VILDEIALLRNRYTKIDFAAPQSSIVNGRSLSFANGRSFMSPRLRQIADQQIAEHAAELLIEAGPGAVTFAEVAKRCGLAPPTLVQRFGHKDVLIGAATRAVQARLPVVFNDAARLNLPLAALIQALQSWAAPHFAILRLAQSTIGQAGYSLELRKQISFALAAAVEAGELPRCDVAMLARTLQITFTGAVAVAALERGDAKAEVARSIEMQLSNYIGDMGL
jgi:AcrR family transcriptional regulator